MGRATFILKRTIRYMKYMECGENINQNNTLLLLRAHIEQFTLFGFFFSAELGILFMKFSTNVCLHMTNMGLIRKWKFCDAGTENGQSKKKSSRPQCEGKKN